MKYVTKKDIVIPAGTVLHEAPTKTERFEECGCAELAIGKDCTMTLYVPIESGYKAFDELVTRLKL